MLLQDLNWLDMETISFLKEALKGERLRVARKCRVKPMHFRTAKRAIGDGVNDAPCSEKGDVKGGNIRN